MIPRKKKTWAFGLCSSVLVARPRVLEGSTVYASYRALKSYSLSVFQKEAARGQRHLPFNWELQLLT